MANTIQLKLLDNKRVETYVNGYPNAYEGGYRIIAGEQNATEFEISSVPAQYENATYSVSMKNSAGQEVPAPTIIDKKFTLPVGMAVAGYGSIVIAATQGDEYVVWSPVKIKVWNTDPNWKFNTIITTVVCDLEANRALVSNDTGEIVSSDITATELSRLDGVRSNVQTQIDDIVNNTAKDAAESAKQAAESAAAASLSAQNAKAYATNVYYMDMPHNNTAIATMDFDPQPIAQDGNTVLAISEDGYLAQYRYSAADNNWELLTAENGGAFDPINLNGAGIENIARSGTTPTGDAVYTITLTNNEKYNFTAPKGDKGDRGDSLVITEWYDSFDALNADFETTSVPNGQYAAIKYTLDYYQKGESAWIYLGNLRFAAGDIAINIDDECRPYATFNNTSDYSVDDLKNDILNGEVIVEHAVNADNLGNLAASQYYSTQNKPTAEDVGLGKTLTITLDLDDESVVSFDGSEDKSITINQSYFHAIMIEFLANGSGDNWRGYITVYIVLPNVTKQNNQLSLGNRIYAMGCTSVDNFYPCTGEINPDLENTTYSVNGIFCTEENKGLSVVYSKTLSHYFGENTTRTAIDVVTQILNINNN